MYVPVYLSYQTEFYRGRIARLTTPKLLLPYNFLFNQFCPHKLVMQLFGRTRYALTSVLDFYLSITYHENSKGEEYKIYYKFLSLSE